MIEQPPVPPATPRQRYSRPRLRPLRSIAALILREMSASYGRSPGGYVWAVLEPLGTIVVFALGFSLLLRTPSLGTSFLLFYATGYLPFRMYSDISGKIAGALKYSSSLLSYPAVGFMDALIARLLLNVLTHAMVNYLILSGILLVIETRAVIDFFPIIGALAMSAILGFGVGAVNCLLFEVLPIWGSIWKVATRPLMIASGVLFILEDLPLAAQNVLWWNPLIHVTGIMRTGFYPTYRASYAEPLYVVAFGLGLSAIGLMLLRRHHRIFGEL